MMKTIYISNIVLCVVAHVFNILDYPGIAFAIASWVMGSAAGMSISELLVMRRTRKLIKEYENKFNRGSQENNQ